MSTELLTELRDIFYEPPSEDVWRHLCAHIDTCAEGDALPVVLNYANEHLGAWPDLLRSAPRSWWQSLQDVGEDPRWSIVRHLRLDPLRSTEAVKMFSEMPSLSSLTILEVNNNNLRVEHMQAIAHNPIFSSLQTLDLGVNKIGNEGVYELATSPHLHKLKHLDLIHNRIGAQGARHLQRSTTLSGLRTLKLWNNNLQYDGCMAISRASFFPQLEELDLGSNRIGDRGAGVLLDALASPHRLRRLNLSGNHISPEIIERYHASAALQGLEMLNLSGNHSPRSLER